MFYIAILALLPKYVRKNGLNIEGLLPYWNFVLFVGSCLGAGTYLFIMVRKHYGSSYYQMICDPEGEAYEGLFGFMAFAFLISKFMEFGDTIFLIAKKKPIDFLHWYHHLTVMFYTWGSVANRNSLGQWFGLINALVHSLMYYYFWRVSLRHRLSWGIVVTVFQTTQMGIGLVLLASWVHYWSAGMECGSEDPMMTVVAGIVMYGSYLFLFLRFFVKRYLSKTHKTSKTQ
uniref:Elongation of fatty acids protein n=1 Tax=Arcella intermedia TaxID=1963864 RepID=A0A6B2LGW9_9EUKA